MHVPERARISREIFRDKRLDGSRAQSIPRYLILGAWNGLCSHPSQQQVLECLFELQNDFLSEEQRRYYTINLPRELVGREARRQIDLTVKRKNEDTSDNELDWGNIELIGELKASNLRRTNRP